MWTCAELARTLVRDGVVDAMSPQTVQRLLQSSRMKPWRVHHWLSPKVARDEAFREIVLDLCGLYTRKPGCTERIVSLDELTSIQPRTRSAATKPARPGPIPVRLEHEYRRKTAVEWVSLAQDIGEALPRGNGNLADQLQRASSSITLNIAEGAKEFSGAEKARFYRIAKRSATECAAILDVAKRRCCIAHEHYGKGRSLLLRIVGMLVKLVRSHCSVIRARAQRSGARPVPLVWQINEGLGR